MLLSIVIHAFLRHEYFKIVLDSVSRQVRSLPCEFEVVVVNDGIEPGIKEICDKYPHLKIRYFFTGHRNYKDKPYWLSPVFVRNYSIRQCRGDLILMNFSDIYVVTDNCFRDMVNAVKDNSKLMACPKCVFDTPDNYNYRLRMGETLREIDSRYDEQMDTYTPFCTIYHKKEIEAIGGFDEDMVGYLYEDRDFVDRMILNGCGLKVLENHLSIHLYHMKGFGGRLGMTQQAYREQMAFNTKLYEERKGIIVRNQGKEWGKL